MTNDTQSHHADTDILGEHSADFSNSYEGRLHDNAIAIGECAVSDEALDAYRQALKTADDRVQTALISRDRRHDLLLTASFVCWVKTAEKSSGYLEGLLGESSVPVAANAASPERAKMSALIRLATGQVAARADINVRISRLAKMAIGIVLECERLGVDVHLGNIAKVTETALAQSRSYFQALVDEREAVPSPKVIVPDNAPVGSGKGAAADDVQPPATSPDQPSASSENSGDAELRPAAVPLRVLPSPSVAAPARPVLLGELQNKLGLEAGIVILIGTIRGDVIKVRGPFNSPQADEFLASLADAAQSAA